MQVTLHEFDGKHVAAAPRIFFANGVAWEALLKGDYLTH